MNQQHACPIRHFKGKYAEFSLAAAPSRRRSQPSADEYFLSLLYLPQGNRGAQIAVIGRQMPEQISRADNIQFFKKLGRLFSNLGKSGQRRVPIHAFLFFKKMGRATLPAPFANIHIIPQK